ncbi:hypothetical protein A6R68_15711, partial [Neotoma lepida]
MHSGDLCLSFRHKVTGLHSGTLQVFVRKHGAHGAALWGRNGGHGWRQTQITLRGADVKSTVEELQQLARARQLSGYLANNPSNEVRFPNCSAKITQDCTVPTPLVFSVPGGLDLEPALQRKGPVSFFV